MSLPPQVVTKAGHPVPKNAAVRINAEDPKYVCRAGFKLEKALDHFVIDVTGATALDSGLSTGGFTHCLLQRGARHVSALCSSCLVAVWAGLCGVRAVDSSWLVGKGAAALALHSHGVKAPFSQLHVTAGYCACSSREEAS